jgi:hypothetical protein
LNGGDLQQKQGHQSQKHETGDNADLGYFRKPDPHILRPFQFLGLGLGIVMVVHGCAFLLLHPFTKADTRPSRGFHKSCKNAEMRQQKQGSIMLNILKATIILAALGAMMLPFGTVRAQTAEDVFTVRDVQVDVTAENAVAAREKAFTEAQKVAFLALAERLLGEGDAARREPPPVSVIATMIRDFEVTQEKLSAVQYMGTYTFRFDGPAVRSHFNMRGQAYTDVASRPMLVLPFYRMGNHTILWRDDNPWMRAWARSTLNTGLVPVRVPLGDIQDVADMPETDPLNYNTASLSTMLQRYGAGEAAILIGTPGAPDSSGVPSDLSVVIYRTDMAVPQFVTTLQIYPDDSGTTEDAFFDKAVRETYRALQSDWKRQTAVDPVAVSAPTQQQKITLRATFTTMQQWVETRQALRRVQGLSDLYIKSVTPREALIEIAFQGDENRLRLALAQADLVMVPRQGYDLVYGGFTPQAYDIYLRKFGPPIQ